jgi:hypothetical protein
MDLETLLLLAQAEIEEQAERIRELENMLEFLRGKLVDANLGHLVFG